MRPPTTGPRIVHFFVSTDAVPNLTGYATIGVLFRRVSEWLAATLEMWCRVTGCGFDPRALRFLSSSASILIALSRIQGSLAGAFAPDLPRVTAIRNA